eukprot:m.364559 g.364559  ORF g.364559 m.364559 type:complete len:73 (-) comp27590_c0_seq1:24-242(-)
MCSLFVCFTTLCRLVKECCELQNFRTRLALSVLKFASNNAPVTACSVDGIHPTPHQLIDYFTLVFFLCHLFM